MAEKCSECPAPVREPFKTVCSGNCAVLRRKRLNRELASIRYVADRVVNNKFELVLLAAHRSRAISRGAPITIERNNDKNSVIVPEDVAYIRDRKDWILQNENNGAILQAG
jgi:hypothetical protein